MLFSKVLGENEKCVFYFYLKTEGNFWSIQYIFQKLLPKKPTKIYNLASFSVKVSALIGKRRILKIGRGTHRQFLMNLRTSDSKFCQASCVSRSNPSFPCLRRSASPSQTP